jgi:hypothetical protein
LSVEAGQQVKSDDCDCVDENHRDLEDKERLQQKRQDAQYCNCADAEYDAERASNVHLPYSKF